jgi:hypothetical protein
VQRLTLADKIHAGVLSIGVAGLVCAYWVAFFHSDLTMPHFVNNLTNPDLIQFATVYIGFESAFPLADLFVAVTSALSAFYLIGRDAKAVLFGLIGSGALGFLALIDISFNYLHGLYAPAILLRDGGLRMEVIINISCAVGAFWSIWRFWGHPLRRAEDRYLRAPPIDAGLAAGDTGHG